ncbi:MAG: hypothetical protein AB7E08_00010 [Candidatus Omnitrophota bacterium]
MKKIGIGIVMVSFIVGFGVSKAVATSLSGSQVMESLYDSIAASRIESIHNSVPRDAALARYNSGVGVIKNPADSIAQTINYAISSLTGKAIDEITGKDLEGITPEQVANLEIPTEDGLGTTIVKARVGSLISELNRELQLPSSVEQEDFIMQFIDQAL